MLRETHSFPHGFSATVFPLGSERAIFLPWTLYSICIKKAWQSSLLVAYHPTLTSYTYHIVGLDSELAQYIESDPAITHHNPSSWNPLTIAWSSSTSTLGTTGLNPRIRLALDPSRHIASSTSCSAPLRQNLAAEDDLLLKAWSSRKGVMGVEAIGGFDSPNSFDHASTCYCISWVSTTSSPSHWHPLPSPRNQSKHPISWYKPVRTAVNNWPLRIVEPDSLLSNLKTHIWYPILWQLPSPIYPELNPHHPPRWIAVSSPFPSLKWRFSLFSKYQTYLFFSMRRIMRM